MWKGIWVWREQRCREHGRWPMGCGGQGPFRKRRTPALLTIMIRLKTVGSAQKKNDLCLFV